MIAFSLAHHWISFSVVLLIFAAVTIYAEAKLIAEEYNEALIYSKLVTVLWILFTAWFGICFNLSSVLHEPRINSRLYQIERLEIQARRAGRANLPAFHEVHSLALRAFIVAGGTISASIN